MFSEHKLFSGQWFLTVNKTHDVVMMASEFRIQSIELLLYSLRMVDDFQLTDISFEILLKSRQTSDRCFSNASSPFEGREGTFGFLGHCRGVRGSTGATKNQQVAGLTVVEPTDILARRYTRLEGPTNEWVLSRLMLIFGLYNFGWGRRYFHGKNSFQFKLTYRKIKQNVKIIMIRMRVFKIII